MRLTRVLCQHRQPMIRFIGKRTTPQKVNHQPQAHPASPTQSLPDSFASYRQQAQQHGPLGEQRASRKSLHGSVSGASLGPVEPKKGQYFDRDELPARFRRTPFTADEIEAIETGGASMWS